MSLKKTTAAKAAKEKVTPAASIRKAEVTAPPAEDATASVTLHVLGGSSYPIKPDEDFQRTAMYWDYVLRNRVRWAHDPNTSQPVTTRALDALNTLGIDDAKL